MVEKGACIECRRCIHNIVCFDIKFTDETHCYSYEPKRRGDMTSIQIYDTDAEKLNEAAAKVGESVATVLEWLIEEHLAETIGEDMYK